MTKEKIKAAVLKKGYVWFNDDANKTYDVNIVGVRNLLPGRKVTNIFDDKLTLTYKDETGNWKFHSWDITTDPGSKAMRDYGNPNGVFRLMPGQYRGMWMIGLHQGKYEALRQRLSSVPGWRDSNKDMVFDESRVVNDGRGINCHRSNPKTQSEYVENWSEGCQVFKRLKDFNEFMAIMRKARDIHGNSFSYTLLTSEDII